MRTLAALLLLASAPLALPAQEAKRPVTPVDYFSLRTVTEFRAYGADAVAYALATWDAADDARKTDIWVRGRGGEHAAYLRPGQRPAPAME